MATIIGTSGNDILHGTSGDDQIYGLDGNDNLNGGSGSNNLFGGAGNDVLDNTAAGTTGGFVSTLEGGSGGDQILGSSGVTDIASYASSAAGVRVDLTAHTALGGDAQGDGISNIDGLIGSAFDDILTADSSLLDSSLSGGAGNDILTLKREGSLDGGAGADTLIGGVASDGPSSIAFYYGSSAGVTVNLVTGRGSGGDAEGDVLRNIDGVNGSGRDDLLIGNAGDNYLNGSDGNDRINGGGGHDYLSGGNGDDWLAGSAGTLSLDGGAGIDTTTFAASAAAVQINLPNGSGQGGDAQGVRFSGIENIVGSHFADTLAGGAEQNRFEGGAGADTLDGGLGIDTASYAGSAAGVVVNLLGGIGFGTGHGGDAEGDVLRGIENLVGSAQADTLSGDGGDNVLEGGAGADILFGRAGLDIASYAGSAAGVTVQLAGGGSGQPTGVGIGTGGDAAGDRLYDIENVLGSAHADRISGDHNDSSLWGDAGDDVLYGNGGNDSLDGGAGNDRLVGGAGADIMVGGDGIDTAYYHDDQGGGVSVDLGAHHGSRGTAAGDTLYGIENLYGTGDRDALAGDDASNVLTGGHGDDVLTGRGGADFFVPGETGGFFPSSGWEVDTITDFSRVQGDKIDLRPIDADGNPANGDTAFTIVTGGVFTGAGHEAIMRFIDGGTEVLLDINGNGLAEMVIKVQGFSLAASDLLL